MKNHFIISYTGNKREEVERIYESFKKTNTITTIIVEPFCGSSALSCYISQQEPNKYTYVLNDLDDNLMKLYETMKDENKYNIFKDELRSIFETITVEIYKQHRGKKGESVPFIWWFIHNLIHTITPGLTNEKSCNPRSAMIKFNKLDSCPIIHFLRTENVILRTENALNILNDYTNNENVLIFLDPPYILQDNTKYEHKGTNIYEHLFYNKIINMSAHVLLCIEYNWIVKIIFPYEQNTYLKRYKAQKNRETTHAIISNR